MVERLVLDQLAQPAVVVVALTTLQHREVREIPQLQVVAETQAEVEAVAVVAVLVRIPVVEVEVQVLLVLDPPDFNTQPAQVLPDKDIRAVEVDTVVAIAPATAVAEYLVLLLDLAKLEQEAVGVEITLAHGAGEDLAAALTEAPAAA
jgi:hypothetical protein